MVLARELEPLSGAATSSAWRASSAKPGGAERCWAAGRSPPGPGRDAQPGARRLTTRAGAAVLFALALPSPVVLRLAAAGGTPALGTGRDAAYSLAGEDRAGRDLANALLKLHEDNGRNGTLTRPTRACARLLAAPAGVAKAARQRLRSAPTDWWALRRGHPRPRTGGGRALARHVIVSETPTPAAACCATRAAQEERARRPATARGCRWASGASTPKA